MVTSPIFSTPRETEVAEVFQTAPSEFQANHAFTLVEFREALADMVSVLRERGDSNIHVSHNYRNSGNTVKLKQQHASFRMMLVT